MTVTEKGHFWRILQFSSNLFYPGVCGYQNFAENTPYGNFLSKYPIMASNVSKVPFSR